VDYKILKKLFVHRSDVYSVQTTKGTYHPIKAQITDSVLKNHVEGKQTIGVYHLNKDDTVKFGCIDIDVNKTTWSKDNFNYSTDWAHIVDQQVREVKSRLTKYNITGYEEFSGFKGSHVWYFFNEPVQASIAKDINEVIFSDMVPVNPELHYEMFPKQNSTNGGYGNLIKLPGGMHKKTDKFSYFIDSVLGDINFVAQEIIDKIISPIDSIFTNCQVMNNLRKQADAGHLTNSERLALAYILLNLGKDGEEILRRILTNTTDYDEIKTNYHIQKIKERAYKPITCKKLQSSEMDYLCPHTCPNIKSGKSPIVFFYRHTGKIMPSDKETVEYFSKQDMIKKDGTKYIYQSKQNGRWEVLSNFIIDINTQINRDDGIETLTIFKGIAIKDDETNPITLKADELASIEKLKSIIYNVIGTEGLYCDNYTFLQHAINKYTSVEKIMIKEIFGYNEDHTKYYSPTTVIDREGIRKNSEIIIDMSKRDMAKSLDIIHIEDEVFYQKVVGNIKDDLLTVSEDFGLSHATLAHTFMPVIEHWLYASDFTRYALFIKGLSGEGKTFLVKAMSHFYARDIKNYANWGSTANNINRMGYDFKDSLYFVDDFKMQLVGKNFDDALKVFQSYADRSSRGRLNRDATIQKSKPILGSLIVTGEDIIDGQSSVVARTIILPFNKTGVKNVAKGGRIFDMINHYSAITARYINYILNFENLLSYVENYRKALHTEFHELIGGTHNAVRISRNYSLLLTSYHMFATWFWEPKEAKTNEKILKEYLKENMMYVSQLTAEQLTTEVFIETFKNLLSVGKIRIQHSDSIDVDKNARFVPIVGFHGEGQTFLLLKITIAEIERYLKSVGRTIGFSINTVINNLYEDDIIKSKTPEKRRFNNQRVQVFLLNEKKLEDV